jgi:hypothetical protein
MKSKIDEIIHDHAVMFNIQREMHVNREWHNACLATTSNVRDQALAKFQEQTHGHLTLRLRTQRWRPPPIPLRGDLLPATVAPTTIAKDVSF